jgi:hypothetical protein
MGSRSRWLHASFAAFCAATLLALTWPGYAWLGERLAQLRFGLPTALAWILLWMAASLVALVALELGAHRRS